MAGITALLSGMIACGPNLACYLVLLAIVAVLFALMLAAIVVESNRLASHIEQCEAARRSCLATRCNIFIYTH